MHKRDVTTEEMLEVMCRSARVLRELGRWDFVLERSMAYFDEAVTNNIVWAGDDKGKDPYPFFWMFPKNGVQKRSQEAMTELRLSLWLEFLALADQEEEQQQPKLPPKKRWREQPRLLMRFSPTKIQRVFAETEEDSVNKSLCV
jgi:hypothetical protein